MSVEHHYGHLPSLCCFSLPPRPSTLLSLKKPSATPTSSASTTTNPLSLSFLNTLRLSPLLTKDPTSPRSKSTRLTSKSSNTPAGSPALTARSKPNSIIAIATTNSTSAFASTSPIPTPLSSCISPPKAPRTCPPPPTPFLLPIPISPS